MLFKSKRHLLLEQKIKECISSIKLNISNTHKVIVIPQTKSMETLKKSLIYILHIQNGSLHNLIDPKMI